MGIVNHSGPKISLKMLILTPTSRTRTVHTFTVVESGIMWLTGQKLSLATDGVFAKENAAVGGNSSKGGGAQPD